MLIVESKTAKQAFSKGAATAPRNHLSFCTVALSVTRSHLSQLLGLRLLSHSMAPSIHSRELFPGVWLI